MEQLKKKIEAAVAESGYDAVLMVGVDNFNYLTRTVLPFAEYYPTRKAAALIPREGSQAVVLPQDWSQAVKDQGWEGEVRVYDENWGYEAEAFVKALKELLVDKGLNRSTVGIDNARISKGLYDSLSGVLPEVNWEPADPMLKELRLNKTSGEIEHIEKACKQADRGIVYALMHLEGTVESPGYTVAEFTERIRVHTYENGGSGVALLNCAFGDEGQIYYTPQRGWVKKNQLFRMDESSHYRGYWTNTGRMGVTGKPTPEQVKAYDDNLMLKEAALEAMRPGVPCNEVYAQVVKAAESQKIRFWREPGIGHGVGASHHEPPYLNPGCATALREGMVIALDIFTYGPGDELVHNKDVYLITRGGNRKLSWYLPWEKLYEIYGFRTTH